MGASYHIFENFSAGLSHLAVHTGTQFETFGQVVDGVYRITIPAGISLLASAPSYHMLTGRANLVTNGSRTYSGELRWRRTAGTQSFNVGITNISGGDFVGATGARGVISASVSDWSVIRFTGGVPSFVFMDRIVLRSNFAGTSELSVFEYDYAKLWIGTEDLPATARKSLVVGGLTL